MKMTMLLFACLCFSCLASDRSDQLPDVNRDKNTNTNTININNNLQLTPKRHKKPHHPTQAGPKHPDVEAAHEALRRKQEEDDFITCCCFFKLKKLPLH